MAKVFPDPVTPSRVADFSPASSQRTSDAIAAGWSPAGCISVTIEKLFESVISVTRGE
jgi:hypothetical protein